MPVQGGCKEQKLFETPDKGACSSKKSIDWTPPYRCGDLILKRSCERGWGFTPYETEKLADDMHDHYNHSDPLLPTSANIWLGGSIRYNWSEAMEWISDELKKRKCSFQVCFNYKKLSFLLGNERKGSPKLSPVGLDLHKFWDRSRYCAPENKRAPSERWPALEVAWLIALNPDVYMAMDGIYVPYMMAYGLVIGDDGIPCFYYNGMNKAFVINGGCDCKEKDWKVTSTVDYREY